MRFWEKNFLYTLALFTALFYICIFVVITTSFYAALSSERDAALREEGFIAESFQNDIVKTVSAESGSANTVASRFSPYSSYYQKKDVYLALYRSDVLTQGSAPSGRALNPSGGRLCDILEHNDSKYIRVTDEITQEYALVYTKDITAAYASLNSRSALLISVSAAVTLMFAFALFFTLKKIYRPVGNLAHELRTPLTIIRGYAEYIEAAAATEEERFSATRYIIDESKRLSEICEKLLIMANLREGDIAFDKVDVKGLFENARMTYKNVVYDIETEFIKGNRALLQSMINNLVSNAQRASSPGDNVRLSSYGNIIEVADSGKGMSFDMLARISKPGAADKAGKSPDGSGLGIALCHQIARLHGAQLKFESSPGEGTSVQIIFTSS